MLALLAILTQPPGHALLREPTMSRTQIVFGYDGDLWTVRRTGGDARRLTIGAGASRPFFSPDGKWLAFTGKREGEAQVYVMPAAGGAPRRLTDHPYGDATIGWSDDGQAIIIRSDRNRFSHFNEYY